MSKKTIAANQRRSLSVMYNKLLPMAVQWADLDPSVMAKLEELADNIRDCMDEMSNQACEEDY